MLFAASTDALLAMKLRAARGKDTDDVAFLLQACEVTTVDEAAEIFEAYYPGTCSARSPKCASSTR